MFDEYEIICWVKNLDKIDLQKNFYFADEVFVDDAVDVSKHPF